MKNAVASVEIYAHRPLADGEAPEVRRLSLVIGAPERAPDGSGWSCRVALADIERPQTCLGPDSFSALQRALAQGRRWVMGLEEQGWTLWRDRAGSLPLVLD